MVAGPADPRLVGDGLVLDDGAGPQLCMGAITLSIPPHCQGIPLRGWTWPVRGVERSGGTTWGDFGVVGTWDGRRFTVDKVVDRDAVRQPPRDDEWDSSSPCPTPSGGWRAPDPARATHDAQSAAIRAAQQLPDYARLWIDDLGDHAQDPAKIVLNVAVTEDTERAERVIREVYGGALCVSRGAHTQAELRRIQEDLIKRPDLVSCGTGRGQHVELGVVFDDGMLQRQLDGKYGVGLVRVFRYMRPYSE